MLIKLHVQIIYACVLISPPVPFIQIILDYCHIQQSKLHRILFNSTLEVGSKWNEIQLKFKREIGSIFGISANTETRRNIPGK